MNWIRALAGAVIVALFSTFPPVQAQTVPNPSYRCNNQTPYGVPQIANAQLVCRLGYVSMYDPVAKIPALVVYTLRPQTAVGCINNNPNFTMDRSVKNPASPQDYNASGFDRGHMTPDDDQSWNNQAKIDSYLMTNVSPQAPSFNRGVWKLLETSLRAWSLQYNKTYVIYVGAVYNMQDGRIGSGVVVPHAFWKMAVDTSTGEVTAWWFPHVAPYPNLGTDLTRYRISLANLQQQAGVRIPLPAGVRDVPVGRELRPDFGALTADKRTTCRVN